MTFNKKPRIYRTVHWLTRPCHDDEIRSSLPTPLKNLNKITEKKLVFLCDLCYRNDLCVFAVMPHAYYYCHYSSRTKRIAPRRTRRNRTPWFGLFCVCVRLVKRSRKFIPSMRGSNVTVLIILLWPMHVVLVWPMKINDNYTLDWKIK